MQAIDPAELQSFQVPPGSLTLWWLGQAGFLLKSPAGTLVAVDPYLSNSCKAIGELIGMEMDRLVPPPLAAADLAGVDLYAITHSHGDHLDPETVAGYRKAGGEGPYLAPPETADKLRELGIPADQIVMTWPNKLYRARDLWIRATLAIPFGPDDLNHVGYIIGVDGGPCAYLTGDTDYHDALATAAAPHKPDVLVAVINGAFRNLSAAEAAAGAAARRGGGHPVPLRPLRRQLPPTTALSDDSEVRGNRRSLPATGTRSAVHVPRVSTVAYRHE